jgi:hypothetical protein
MTECRRRGGSVTDLAVRTCVLDMVIPVHNEERDLPGSVRRLHSYLATEVPYASQITVADNASTDSTLAVAQALADGLPGVDVIHLDAKGRGGALYTAWMSSGADVVAYMDVDLSTDLSALMPLVAPLISGHSDIAIGSRLAVSSRVVRGPKREFVSRSYNLILRGALGARFSDAQCGFKAVRADVARHLLPLIADTGWFFDTELLVIAERAGLRIHEVPVEWVDHPDSRVDIARTAVDDLKGCWRVGSALASGALPVRTLQRSLGREPLVPGVPHGMVGQMVRFGIVGIASTVAFAMLYLLLHPAVGGQAANLTALLLTAIPTPRPTGPSRSASGGAPAWRGTSCTACWCSCSGWRSPAGRCSCCTASTRRSARWWNCRCSWWRIWWRRSSDSSRCEEFSAPSGAHVAFGRRETN